MMTWICTCGAANDVAQTVCDLCGTDRPRRSPPQAPADAGLNRCARCSSTSPSIAPFDADGAPEDRGVQLCPACWIPALRRRAERDPISAEARAALRHQLYADLDVIAARTAAVQRRSPAPKAEVP